MKISRSILSLAFGSLLLVGLTLPAAAAPSKSTDGKKSSASSSASSGTGAHSGSGSAKSAAGTTGQITTTTTNAEGYAATAPMQIGTIVQLANSSANEVAPATQANLGHMYGVTVDPHSLSVTIASSALQNETYVATTGTWNTLVDTQGGTIQPGDYVTLSAVDGVAMKASSDQKTVFGRAAAGFDGKSNGIGSVSLKDTNGKSDQTVTLGLIPVTIDVRSNPIQKSTKTNLPNFLQRVGLAIAEKPISAFRIYLSTAITVLTIIVAIAMLSSGVRSSIFSIGRNPLSKKTIIRALFSVILASMIILTIGLFAVYLILKL